MPRDWTELVDGFRRDCDNSCVPASLVQALHEDNSIFEDLWKYLTTPNDMAEVEPGGMNCEMALQMLLKLSLQEDDLCRALFMSQGDFRFELQDRTRKLYGDDPENEWVALANGSDPATRAALEGQRQNPGNLPSAGIPDAETKPPADSPVPMDLSTSPDALPPGGYAVPMDLGTPEDVRGQCGQPQSPAQTRPASAESAGPPWRRSGAPSPDLSSSLRRTGKEDPRVEPDKWWVQRSLQYPALESMETHEEQTLLAVLKISQEVFRLMLEAVVKGNATEVGDFLRNLARTPIDELRLAEDEYRGKGELDEALTWYAVCLLTWQKSDIAGPVGPHGQEMQSREKLAQDLGVTPDLLRGSQGSLTQLHKDILKMEAYRGIASQCAMEQGCNIAAVTNDIVSCLLGTSSQRTDNVGKPDLHEARKFIAMSAFVSNLRHVERKSSDAEFAEFWHAMSATDLGGESRWPLQELLCFTMDCTGGAREVMAECYTIILDCLERHRAVTDSPLEKVFNGADERVVALLNHGFLTPSGPWVLQLGLRLRRVLGDRVKLFEKTSELATAADLTALLGSASGSGATEKAEEVEILFPSTLWDLGGGPLMWTAKQLLVHKQRSNTLVSGQENLSVVQALDEFFQQMRLLKDLPPSVRERLWREEEEPAVFKALLLRWVAVGNASGQFSPALLAGLVYMLTKESCLNEDRLADGLGLLFNASDLEKMEQIVGRMRAYLKMSGQDNPAKEDIDEWIQDCLEDRTYSTGALSMLLAAIAIHCKHVQPTYCGMRLVFGLARSTFMLQFGNAPLLVNADDPVKHLKLALDAIGAFLDSILALILDSGSDIARRQALNRLWNDGDITPQFYTELGRCERLAEPANDMRVASVARQIFLRLMEFVQDRTNPEGSGQ